MNKQILEVLDILIKPDVKTHLDSAIPTYALPLLVTVKNSATITPLMIWLYERIIRKRTLDIEGINLPHINRIDYIKPLIELEWDPQMVVPDWGDLGLYMWNMTGKNRHAVIIINMHQIRYSRYTHMLKVLKKLTLETVNAAITQNHFAWCITHIIIQHLECLPADNIAEFMSIIEGTITNGGVNIAIPNKFRYYMFTSCNMSNWRSSEIKKLKGLTRHCAVSYKTKPLVCINSNSNPNSNSISDDLPENWYYMMKLLGGDIIKTMVLYEQMPHIDNTDNITDMRDNIYAYVATALPGYICLDRFISKIISINVTSGKKLSRCQIADIFQLPILLANALISAGYNLATIIHITNTVCNHNKILKENTKPIIKILEYGSICMQASRDIDKPVMALTKYLQNIITLFYTPDMLC